MGLARLQGFLSRHNRIALDTNIFIYQLQSNPRYELLTDAIFHWLEKPGHCALTSTIGMTELLVQPYRNSEQDIVDQYYAQLATYPNLEWIAPNLAVADIAARIRATHKLRTPDALQAATAIHAGATALATNDPIFQRVQSIQTLVLDHLL